MPRWNDVPDDTLGKVDSEVGSLVYLPTTTADDFAKYLGSLRNLGLQGSQLALDWASSPPKLLWKRAIGAGWSAFSAVNGYAVTMEQRGDEEWFTCYEIATGNLVWGHATSARHKNVLGGIGPRGTPT